MNIYRYIQEKVLSSNSSSRMEGDPNSELNGTIFKNYIIPADIITHMMSFLDGKSILACRLVCKNWEELVLVTLKTLYRHRFSLPTDDLSFEYLYIRLYTNIVDRNLLKNVNGEEGFKHWTILQNGGDQFIVEDVPLGCDPLPENIKEFNGHKSCFVSSYRTCIKQQIIKIKSNPLIRRLLKEKPKIYASEWIASRFDCGGHYRMRISLCRGKDHIVVTHGEASCNLQAGDITWQKVELEFLDYPEDITSIIFEHFGKDNQFWAGHYGVKMAGAVVKFAPTK